MESILSLLFIAFLLVVFVSFVVFMFSVHWSLGIIAILLIFFR